MYKEMEDLEIGQIHSKEYLVSKEMILQFGTLTNDDNPLHSDHEFGKKTRFKDINAQGMLLGSLIIGIIGSDLPGPGWMCLGVDTSFNLPVFPKDKIKVSAKVEQIVNALGVVILSGEIRNENNEITCKAKIKVQKLEIKNDI